MKAKRFLSVLLAVMLCLSVFAISASADALDRPTTGTLNIHMYKGTNALDTADSVTGEEVTTGLPTDRILGVVFKAYKVADNETNNTDPVATDTEFTLDASATGDVTSTALAAGRYFVYVDSKPANVGTIRSFLVDVPMTNPTGDGWISNVHVYPKTTIGDIENPTVEKDVAAEPETGAPTFAHSANLKKDQYAIWRITVPVPTGISFYKKLEISDTVDSRLSDPEDITLTIDGAADDAADPIFNNTGTTGKTIKFAVNAGKFASLTAGQNIVITYKTKITGNLAATLIPNHVDLTYKNDPTNASEPDKTTDNHPNNPDPDNDNDGNPDPTPDDDHDPFVWTGEVKILKNGVEGTTTTTLSGVEFTLTGTDYTSTVTTDANGKFAFEGLLDGTYTLSETKTIAGYELNAAPVTITVAQGKATATPVANFATQAAAGAEVVLVNIKSTKLPLTGGMGVAVFAIMGLTLTAAGVFLLKSKKYE